MDFSKRGRYMVFLIVILLIIGPSTVSLATPAKQEPVPKSMITDLSIDDLSTKLPTLLPNPLTTPLRDLYDEIPNMFQDVGMTCTPKVECSYDSDGKWKCTVSVSCTF